MKVRKILEGKEKVERTLKIWKLSALQSKIGETTIEQRSENTTKQ
jgi:hypothetical protein